MVISPGCAPPQPRLAGTQAGFTYLGLLLAMALSAIGLAAAGVAWHTASQRAKEAELLFIGGEFKRAIASYHKSTPGPVGQLPKRLEDLLLDARSPAVRRHLRKIYVDPMTGKAEWGLVATPAGIAGVHSLSGREPFRGRASSAQAAQAARYREPAESAAQHAWKYSDWKFVAVLEQTAAPSAVVKPGAPAPRPQPQLQSPNQVQVQPFVQPVTTRAAARPLTGTPRSEPSTDSPAK